jgi:cellulose synthase/poly-beta-1,6-N-acetylglucosamine synthase-like glycosyltransferase
LVSAIIPARNEEASIARAVESVAAQPEVGEVIVVNDQSTDGTGAILEQMALRVPKLKVIDAGDLPPGWTGKNHVVSLGAAAAQGEWLLFTDADTFHLPGSTRRALADAVDHDAVLVSYSPEQEMETFWERALIPVVFCRLAAKFSYARVNNPRHSEAAANGQFLMVLRDAYEAVGGHRAIGSEILEDVALARRIKQQGYGIYFTAPIGVVRARMYRSLASMWEGWTKNLYLLAGGTPRAALLELAESLPWLELGIIALPLILFRTQFAAAPLLWLVFFLMGMAGLHMPYAITLYRNLYSTSHVKYYVPGICLYGAALIASWWKHTHGTILWKGRAYPAKTL